MAMRYILLRISPNNNSSDFDCYQEIGEDGNLVGYKDLDGNIIDLHDHGEYSGWVLDAEPPFPAWGI